MAERRIVYLAHKVDGDSNILQDVLELCKSIRSETIIPFVPYIFSLQYLEPAEASLDTKEFFRRRIIDELWICGDMISDEMKEEIYLALVYHISIKCHTSELKEKLKQVILELQTTRMMREI